VVLTYTAAVWLRPLRAATAALVLWLPPLVLGLAVLDTRRPPLRMEPVQFVVFLLMTVLLAVAVGRTVHHRRAFVAALQGRARDAELNQRALAEQAVADERRRIARELHDMVAHHVSVMGVLATGSRRTLRRDPAAADEALATIEETGRTALRELRRLLDILRTEHEPAGELAPQPGLAHLPGLVEQVREAGLPVALRMQGETGALDPGIALTVYRIVQEALTNAIKHAGSATAEVRLEVGTYWLTVEVCDTGRGPALGDGSVGHGLLGMRERVMLYGGTLRTGPRPGGGFRVSARIPVDALHGNPAA
jgi:signal transduction histidine kinase